MKVLMVSSGLSALVSIPFLAPPADAASAAVAESRAPAAPIARGVPRLETSAAQLAHAAACKTAMRGKAGEALESARAAAIEAYRAVREHFASDARACAEASFRAGELLRAASDPAAAIAEFQLARDLGAETPFRVRAMLEIGHVHRRARKHAEKCQICQFLLGADGNVPVAIVDGDVDRGRDRRQDYRQRCDRRKARPVIALARNGSGSRRGARRHCAQSEPGIALDGCLRNSSRRRGSGSDRYG